MSTIYPPTVVDRDGTTWTWSDLWGAYRASGHMAHGIETLRSERGPITIVKRADTDPAYCGYCDHHADQHDYGRTVDEHHSVPCQDCPNGVCDRTDPADLVDTHAFEPYHRDPERCGYLAGEDEMCGYARSEHRSAIERPQPYRTDGPHGHPGFCAADRYDPDVADRLANNAQREHGAA